MVRLMIHRLNCLQWNPPNDKYLGTLTWVKLAYHDTGCSLHVKMQDKFSCYIKLFSITCGECHMSMKKASLFAWKDVDAYIVMVTFKTCMTSGLPSWCGNG